MLKNGIYADYVEKWYWKEFHFSTKNKKKKMTDEEFQKEVEIWIAKARKDFYDILFGVEKPKAIFPNSLKKRKETEPYNQAKVRPKRPKIIRCNDIRSEDNNSREDESRKGKPQQKQLRKMMRENTMKYSDL